MGHTNGYVKGIGAVASLMQFYDRASVPLGSYKGAWAKNPRAPGVSSQAAVCSLLVIRGPVLTGCLRRQAKGTADRYVPDLSQNYPTATKDSSQTPSAVDVYRAA